MEKLFLGVYWFNRKETIKTAAEKLVELFYELSRQDKVFAELKAASLLKAINRELNFNDPRAAVIDQLAEIILENRRGSIKKFHPGVTPSVDFHEPIGFTQSFDVKEMKKMNISSTIGCYSRGITNVFYIEFPADYNYDYEKIYNLFTAVIRILNVDWGTVQSTKFKALVPGEVLPALRVGWFNYFSNKLSLADIPGVISTEKLHEGILTCTTGKGEIFSSENADHVSNSMKLIEYLKSRNINMNSFE